MDFTSPENKRATKDMVLVVGDDTGQTQALSRSIKKQGYETMAARTASGALSAIKKHKPGLIILDSGIPDGDRFALCIDIRRITDEPVLFLTGGDEGGSDFDRIAGLDAGADYFLTKPYDISELYAVIRSLLNRAKRLRESASGAAVVEKGSLSLNIRERKAHVNGRDAGLSPTEFALLLLLVQNEDCEIPSDKLYEGVWDAPMNKNTGAVRVHISNLKRKLGEENAVDFSIFSERGKGYIFSTV